MRTNGNKQNLSLSVTLDTEAARKEAAKYAAEIGKLISPKFNTPQVAQSLAAEARQRQALARVMQAEASVRRAASQAATADAKSQEAGLRVGEREQRIRTETARTLRLESDARRLNSQAVLAEARAQETAARAVDRRRRVVVSNPGNGRPSRLSGSIASGIVGVELMSETAQFVISESKAAKDAARDLQDALNASQVIWKRNASSIEDWASTAASASGQSKREALQASSTFGNLFLNLGLGSENAETMSKNLVQMASDLAGLYGGPVEQALNALRAAMRGEMDPIEQCGVALQDAQLRQEAVRLGLTRTIHEGLEPATKAQAAYSLLVKQTSVAHGDFARTAGDVANQERILQAEFENLRADLGQRLLPVWKTLLGVARDTVDAFGETPDATKQVALAVAGLAAASGPLALLINKLGEVRGAMISAGLLTPATAAIGATVAGLAGTAAVMLDSNIQGSNREIKAAGSPWSQDLRKRIKSNRQIYSYTAAFLMNQEDRSDTRSFIPRNEFATEALKAAGATFDPQTGAATADPNKVRQTLREIWEEIERDERALPGETAVEKAGAARTAAQTSRSLLSQRSSLRRHRAPKKRDGSGKTPAGSRSRGATNRSG